MEFSHISIIIVSIVVILLLLVLLILLRKARKLPVSAGNEQIYIGNLPYRTNESDLQKRFEHYGHIINVRIVKDRPSGRSKGYAFITFSNAREAEKALADHGKELAGRSLVVHIAKPR